MPFRTASNGKLRQLRQGGAQSPESLAILESSVDIESYGINQRSLFTIFEESAHRPERLDCHVTNGRVLARAIEYQIWMRCS